ncbi:12578_t:CDS:1, partial [Entrophospora sp. SA101]
MPHDSDCEESSQFSRLYANLDALTCGCFDKMQYGFHPSKK